MAGRKEKIKSHFVGLANLENKLLLLFTVLGGLTGYLSFLLNSPLRSSILALAILVASVLLNQKLLKVKEGKKWWINKVAIFVFTWIIIWTIYFNIYIVKGI